MTIEAGQPPLAGQPTSVRQAGARRPLGELGRAALGRAGRAALLATGRPPVPDALEPLVRVHRRHHPQADLALLARAYRLAEASHRGQKRKSGEPYITHPLAVTMILAQLGAGTTTLVASLLHDTVEDTELTLDQVGAGFGPEVAYLVDGVTKLEKVDFGAAAEAETFRKMLVATGDDVRVMVIKLADRLHNMRTIRHMKPASQVRIAKVTRDVLIPLAERLGIQVLKAELEDIVFATLHPEEHARTRALMAAHEAEPDALLEPFARRLARQLAEAGVAAEVTVRPRHCVSLHRVLVKRAAAPGPDGQPQRPQPADFGRLLVVVEENADCYAVLGELHTCWTPLPGEFKDFVAAPKFNLYQSLHTAVALDGEVVEVLVRTRRMHEVAETGVVALGDPSRTGAAQDADELDRTDPARPGWLSRLLEWQQETPDPDAFWSALTADLAGDREITVVTESGETLQLRAGASCVDAAYLLGEETGHRCIGARVNGRLTALSTVLQDGDVLAVLTEGPPAGSGQRGAEPSGPSPEWLAHARTPAARLAIERWLADHPARLPVVRTGPAGGQPAPPAHPAGERRSAPVAVAGRPGATVRLARCCTPVPPDEVAGYPIRGGAVAVHRTGCPAGQRLRADGRAELEVRWQPEDAPAAGHRAVLLRATLRAEALNRPRLLADLTAAISAEGVGIVSAEVEPPQELRVRHTYTVELPEPGALPALMRAMLRVSGVYDVSRPHAPEGTQTRHSGGNGGDRPGPDMGPSWGIHGRSTAFPEHRGSGGTQGPPPQHSSDQRTE
ncbi:RelA/SpoT family protein [Kitasatospora aureofaciens]|uniref:Kinase n=4 Tax=Kitasatospora aureofaciens TaxID=1894 RepID=A0A8H9HXF8_KITAU|nr:HD domain-containing protein [Kitasatospora aureofaciens]ARF78480.1 bifunctional (p)ppGpp synthetase/guanosine-3',5'-bis(diphosphate) 3'-pyrophosphohydrolase [Kitasatospora aureofaciens]QEU99691.1 bifunctional (p)ppGpp synthetase/guanosine-3',5'-bis(diphosphate) 3'-pyrophosphohydrolase [Streptomyces viridifaciens]UKZ05812.1 HD domain-containing protein [Streptomyces viridifaciens]GGU94575.1 kinase [Kitasatospora aureofaciens]